MPISRIWLTWHFGFAGCGILGLLALAFILARKAYKWIWMPIAGLGFTIVFAAATEHLMDIW